MLVYSFLVILIRFLPNMSEKIVFGYRLGTGNSNGYYLIGNYNDVDITKCVNLCKGTDRCTFINYHRLAKVCDIIGQTTPMIISSAIVRHNGFIYGNKSEWTIGTGHTNRKAGCGPPPSIYMTTIRGNMYVAGSVTQYVCTNNVSLTVRTICKDDGSWRDTILICVTDCASAPVLNNAVQLGSSSNIGAQITYTCSQPYVKTETITCQQDGTWSDLTIQCIPDECYTSPHTEVHIYGSSCYKYISVLNQWDGARSNCESLGGNLVIISNETEMAELGAYVQTIPNYNYPSDSQRLYIGLTDKDVQGTFAWLDGHVTTFTNWAAGEPNGGTTEDCVMFATWNKLWYDMRCSRMLGSLCEFNIQ